MSDLVLHIANKNYSSWSLRPWVLLRMLGVPFEERLHPFSGPRFTFSPSSKVPCLVDVDTTVWDSLAIVEFLAETNPGVWPTERKARAWARSATAEMHSGFPALRTQCAMNCGVRVALHTLDEDLEEDLLRLDRRWVEGLERFGGLFLAGTDFTAVDAFYAPVAFRLQTYGIEISTPAMAYAERLRGLAPMQEWYAAGLAETWRDASHDAELPRWGKITEDLRAPR